MIVESQLAHIVTLVSLSEFLAPVHKANLDIRKNLLQVDQSMPNVEVVLPGRQPPIMC